MKTAYDIINTILVTEKSSDLMGEDKYVFKVAPNSTKIEVRNAVEQLFDVKVKSVNVMNYNGKPKRTGRTANMGRRANWRKAIVTLSEGTIDVFN